MKALIAALLAVPLTANAGSWFNFEAGLGLSRSGDMGDGTWIQQGARNNREQMTAPVYMTGLTGDVGEHLSWHADYVYIGGVSASVDGVPDDHYDPVHHRVTGHVPRYSAFNGQGHMQGVALTVEARTEWNGWRFGVEAGPWLYFATWHESLYDLNNRWVDLSHKTDLQIGYVVGARVSNGSLSLSYRYYSAKPLWNPYPGIITRTHVLMITKTF